MTARTPLETLTLARDYLDSLLTENPPLWGTEAMEGGPKGLTAIVAGSVIVVGSTLAQTAANLIVALHATAPAIREMLDQQVDWLSSLFAQLDHAKADDDWLAIAETLLSTSHAEQWITEREAK